MSKLAGLYARVSGDGQLNGSSPESQLMHCREYCVARGYKIVSEQIESISGTFIFARSKFNSLLKMAEDEQISVIVVDIPDRLGRGDVIAQLELLARLYGISIEYATPGRDTSTIEGIALKATDQLVSGIERMNIRRRTMGGRRALAQGGRVIASRYRPYGYDFVSEYDERGRKKSCKLEIVESEARVVRQIFEWCVEECLSCYAIAKRLTARGVPKPSETRGNYIVRSATQKGKWNRTTIYQILSNRTYMGEWQHGKRLIERMDTPDGVRSKLTQSRRADAITVPVPPIVSADLWDAAQGQLIENRKKFLKPTKYPYLLRGRVRCALCGAHYVGESSKSRNGKTYTHYLCKRAQGGLNGNQCDAKQISTRYLEPAVWGCVREALLDEKRLFAGIAEMREQGQRARRMIEGTLAALVAQDEKDKQKLARLLDLYSGGDLDKETYLAKRAEVQGKIDKRAAERADIESRLGQYRVLDPTQEAELRAMRAELAKRLEWGTIEERQRLLEMLQLECFYDSRTKEVTVTGLIGKRTVATTSHAETARNF